MNKRKTVLYIGVFASVLFSYLSFRKIDYYVLLNNFNEISIGPVFISILFLLLSYFLRAIRWKNILVNSNLKFANLYSASMIGNMGNNILPFRIGELIRCYILGYQENISKSRVLASVMFERVLDGITVIVFFAISLLFTNVGDIFINGAVIAFLLFGFILLVMIISKNYEDKFFNKLTDIFYFIPDKVKARLSNISSSFLTGLDIINNKKYLLISIIYSFLFWGSGILGAYFLLLSTKNPIPLDLPIILTSALVIGVMIPSAPGFIGTYHYVVILILGLYGWDKETAVGMSIILHGIQFVVPIIIGLALTIKLGYSLKDLMNNNIKESKQ